MYANNEPLDKSDVVNLNTIKKKLKVSLRDLARAQNSKQEYDTEDQWLRTLLKVPEDTNISEYLNARLNEREINTMKKFLKPGIL